ncbi:hypothetical protein KKE60_04845 [Patescibacteria group bacterium]|nr:hypothetical protein [Patescibacteria group bacterium]
MKYRVELTVYGYVDIEASSKEEAEKIVEDGYSFNDLNFVNDEIDAVELIN